MFTFQFIRGTTAQNLAWTGPSGSLSIDTELNQLRLHDGVTAGGHVLETDPSVIQNLQDQLDNLGLGDVNGLVDALAGKIGTDQIGVANGVAGLDAQGFVPAIQLPSFVDDVVEFADLASFPEEGESGKLYVAIDTASIYRWSGSIYVEIQAAPGTTDDVVEGIENLYFTQARARAAVSATGDLSYDAETGVFSYTAPVVDKESLGLDLVQNFGIADEPAAVAAVSNELYMTPLRTRDFVESIGFEQDVEGNWSLDAGVLPAVE